MLSLIVFLYFSLLVSPCRATTDPNDLLALQDLYQTLNKSPQLFGWKARGGDPCGEAWKGISCVGSSVVQINLRGLYLHGYLKGKFNLQSLRHLDLGCNKIHGEIPYLLPPNATFIDLSFNILNKSIPYTLSSLTSLQHLNLSHNVLSGQLGDIFTGMHSLKQMDLSYNHFSGEIPPSFGDMANLTELYLQNNTFKGPISILANLGLIDLNIQNNHFSGAFPEELLYVKHLWISGNNFQLGTPFAKPKDENRTRRLSSTTITFVILGVVLCTSFSGIIIFVIVRTIRRPKNRPLESEKIFKIC